MGRLSSLGLLHGLLHGGSVPGTMLLEGGGAGLDCGGRRWGGGACGVGWLVGPRCTNGRVLERVRVETRLRATRQSSSVLR